MAGNQTVAPQQRQSFFLGFIFNNAEKLVVKNIFRQITDFLTGFTDALFVHMTDVLADFALSCIIIHFTSVQPQNICCLIPMLFLFRNHHRQFPINFTIAAIRHISQCISCTCCISCRHIELCLIIFKKPLLHFLLKILNMCDCFLCIRQQNIAMPTTGINQIGSRQLCFFQKQINDMLHHNFQIERPCSQCFQRIFGGNGINKVLNARYIH